MDTFGNPGENGSLDVVSKSLHQEPAAAVWRETLSRFPAVFGRLVYLASLCDAGTGRYFHPSLNATIGDEDADRGLCDIHYQVFSQWIGFSLAEQKADLELYIRHAGGKQLLYQYIKLVPRTAREVERQLYLTDLETLIELMRYQTGGYAVPEA